MRKHGAQLIRRYIGILTDLDSFFSLHHLFRTLIVCVYIYIMDKDGCFNRKFYTNLVFVGKPIVFACTCFCVGC